MPRVTVDFSEVQDFEALPAGEYPVVIDKATFREPQEEGKFPYINLALKVTEGEHEGRMFWMILSFSPKAIWRMKQVFDNLGIIDEDDELDVDYEEGADGEYIVTSPELAGLPAIAAVTQRPYENRMQNQVDALIAPEDDVPVKAQKENGKTSRSKETSAKPKRRFQ